MTSPLSKPHKIEIEIDEKGNIQSTLKGIEGPGCDGICDWLDELGEVTEDLKTADYHKKPKQTVRVGR